MGGGGVPLRWASSTKVPQAVGGLIHGIAEQLKEHLYTSRVDGFSTGSGRQR